MSTTDVATAEPAADPAPAAGASRHRGGGLGRYLLVRVLLIFPTVLILVTVVFVLMRSTGDPITAALGGRLGPEQLKERIHAAGYDKPILVQYWHYVSGIAHGDFGTTITDHRPVTQVLTTFGSATLELAVYALVVAFLIGIPLGRIAAARRDKGPDAVLRVSAILAYATPVFFAGMVLKLVFAVWLNVLPVAGRATTRSILTMKTQGAGTGVYLI
ncbi:MAG: ABC transporter permease, partial [Cellulomonas sp.]|nr:ABC transporter permease [Cellulomonas sp.]